MALNLNAFLYTPTVTAASAAALVRLSKVLSARPPCLFNGCCSRSSEVPLTQDFFRFFLCLNQISDPVAMSRLRHDCAPHHLH
jgi:hypothetical protein